MHLTMFPNCCMVYLWIGWPEPGYRLKQSAEMGKLNQKMYDPAYLYDYNWESTGDPGYDTEKDIREFYEKYVHEKPIPVITVLGRDNNQNWGRLVKSLGFVEFATGDSYGSRNGNHLYIRNLGYNCWRQPELGIKTREISGQGGWVDTKKKGIYA